MRNTLGPTLSWNPTDIAEQVLDDFENDGIPYINVLCSEFQHLNQPTLPAQVSPLTMGLTDLLLDHDTNVPHQPHPYPMTYVTSNCNQHQPCDADNHLLLCHASAHSYEHLHCHLQLDGGVNCSVTNKQMLLTQYQVITKYTMSSVAKDNLAIFCTGKGYIP